MTEPELALPDGCNLTPNRTGLRYDRFGRTRLLPSTDTVDAGGDLTIDYYLNDLVASQTQAGRTTSYTLDPALRRTVRTDTTTTNPTPAVTVNHYDDDTDNPDWTDEPDGTWTRNTSGLGDLAATVSSTGTVTLQLADLHGDILATVSATASSPTDLQLQETTEYGLPRTKPAASTLLARYGYLGAKQRDASTPGGLTLMGARLYTPTLGRFLTTDPQPGGSANDYDYVSADPVNNVDLDGNRQEAGDGPGWGQHYAGPHRASFSYHPRSRKCSGWRAWSCRAGRALGRVSTFAGYIPFCSACAAFSAATGALAVGFYVVGGDRGSAWRQARSTAVGVATGGGLGRVARGLRVGGQAGRFLRGGTIRVFSRAARNAGRGRGYRQYWGTKIHVVGVYSSYQAGR